MASPAGQVRPGGQRGTTLFLVRTRPQGGPPTAHVQEKAAECGHLGLVISWVEEQPFQSSRGRRVPGPSLAPHLRCENCSGSQAIAPNPASAPADSLETSPRASSWSRSRTFCRARCRKPGLQVPEVLLS